MDDELVNLARIQKRPDELAAADEPDVLSPAPLQRPAELLQVAFQQLDLRVGRRLQTPREDVTRLYTTAIGPGEPAIVPFC